MVNSTIVYNRDTELRCIQPNDIYKLAVILDENDGWKKLMEVIPKDVDAYNKSNYKLNIIARKYNNDHVRLLEDAAKRSTETRLFSQILFDEWGTSGRKHQRPTLEIILKLLTEIQQFRAADFITEHLLKETSIQRPVIGPAAKVNISLPSDIFHDIENAISDGSFDLNTENLNESQQLLANNNFDFYTKYHKLVNKQINISDDFPKPPPRLQKLAKLKGKKQEQQQSQEHQNENEQTSLKLESGLDSNDEVSALISGVGDIDLTTMNSSLENDSLSTMNLLNQNNASGTVDFTSERRKSENTDLPFLSLLNLDRISEDSLSSSICANGDLSYTKDISKTNNNTQNAHVEAINEEVNCNYNDEKDKYDNSIPNLSIFR